MRPIKIKDRCTKRKLKKCEDIARLYDDIQNAYAKLLEEDNSISQINCNVPLENLDIGEFSSDFLCLKSDGDYMVRECVFRKKLSLPRTARLLDASRTYWLRHGVNDWGIVIEKEKANG